MAINIKNNFGPMIEAKDNVTINIGSDDAVKRYNAVRKIVGDNIEDVNFDEISTEKKEELKKACSETAKEKKASAPKKKEQFKLKNATFRYVYYDDEKGFVRLKVLFDFLKECGWLDKDSGLKEWEEIFSGNPSTAMLIWHGSQSQLKFLFKFMMDGTYIKPQMGCGPYEILGSHFKKPDNTLFVNWNDYKTPAARDSDILMRMANFLDINRDIKLDKSMFSKYVKERINSAESCHNPYLNQKQSQSFSDEDAGIDFENM